MNNMTSTTSISKHTVSIMNEDERYRTSTQYRLWSYTPGALASLRSTTNRLATERVKAAIERARASRATSASASADTSEAEQNGTNNRAASAVPEGEVNCLTPEEELKLVVFYCRQTIQLGDHLKVPTDVKVTPPSLQSLRCITNITRQQQSNTSNASTSATLS